VLCSRNSTGLNSSIVIITSYCRFHGRLAGRIPFATLVSHTHTRLGTAALDLRPAPKLEDHPCRLSAGLSLLNGSRLLHPIPEDVPYLGDRYPSKAFYTLSVKLSDFIV